MTQRPVLVRGPGIGERLSMWTNRDKSDMWNGFWLALPAVHEFYFNFFPLGFFYNIVCVPPYDEQAVAKDFPDLSGAKVICSIRASEPRKPSYYHSFGETRSVSTEPFN